jgi:ABC-type transport system involved in multi-copper enzyme maturation permease subunit
MSTTAIESDPQETSARAHGSGYHGWALWTRQTLAILQLELVKNFWGRRALLLYVIAALPVALVSMLSLIPPDADEMRELGRLSQVYAAIYGGLILRTLIFFGCAWVFMNLFRGEVVDRSLHYYFLSPVRREVLVVGKYLSGLIATIILFGSATAASMLILFYGLLPAEASAYFLGGIGARHLLTYVGVTILACIGYGAVFLIVGLFFRNPVVPALLLYGWEWLNFLLPPGLKKISVVHYLHSLVPVPLSEGPFAVLAEPTPAYLAIPSLFVFTAVVIVLAGLHIRRMEISYAGE